MNHQSIHISFLRDAHIYGFYHTDIDSCIRQYPQLKQNISFDFYTMILCRSKEISLIINDKKISEEKERLFLIPPFTNFLLNTRAKTSGSILFFCKDFYVADFNSIHLIFLYSFFNKLRKEKTQYYIDLPSGYDDIATLFGLIATEHDKKQKSSTPILRSYLNAIIHRLISLVNNGTVADNNVQLLDKLSSLIETHFREQRSSEFYARQTGVSEKILNELCNTIFGSGFKQLIMERTMMEARKMLEQTTLTVAEIGFNLHFSDNSNFNKTFKAFTRTTPRRYREMHKRLV